MILRALYDYYQRKANDPDSNIAPFGLEWKEIPFLIVIDEDGRFVNLEDTREQVGKKKLAQRFLVIKSRGRTGKNSWQTANVFWDHYGYVLAFPKKDSKKTEEENKKAAKKQYETFLKQVKDCAGEFSENRQIQAALMFYSNFEENVKKIQNHDSWPECRNIPGANMSFRLVDSTNIVAEHNDVTTWELQRQKVNDLKEAVCLVTGKRGPIATLHTQTPIAGGKAKAKFVSFQKDSGYDSYYKEQGLNAPVSLEAEAAYTTALNTLLAKNSSNQLKLCDTTYVFWASEQNNILEKTLLSFANFPDKDNPDRNIQEIRAVLQAVETGVLNTDRQSMFYILGLAPNGARISIRLWKIGTTHDFAVNIARHFADLKMVKGPKDKEYFPLFTLLSHTALDYKIDNVQPNMAGAVFSAALDGTAYPETLQQQCLRRIKAEQRVNYVRASILKACLNRKIRRKNYTNGKEISVALDRENENAGYLCGRLFAVLEKIQEEAHPEGLNATIKDRYYGAASSTPATVFGRLIGLSNHHLGKLDKGQKIHFEKQITGIMSLIPSNGFSAHLSLDDQARFAIGYYHQRQNFFTKKNTEEK